MPVPISLLVVNYRSSALALEAIRSARAATRSPLQVVVVDNSVDPAEAECLRGSADALLVSERNDGYAAAINRGRRACDGEVIVASNADVVFASGALDALAEANAAVAGPALFWDDAHEWILPPSELHTFGETLDRALATRSRTYARGRDRRRIRERLAFWSLTATTRVEAISGAVMAIRAKAFDDAGGFDERFPLYFEENDFLRRVRGDVVYVPAARVRHLYNQSAAGSPQAAAAYAESEAHYLRKWSRAALLAKKIETTPPQPDASLWKTDTLVCPPLPTKNDRQECLSYTDCLVEVSPLPDFDTSAGHFPRGAETALPAEVWAAYRGERLWLRVIDRRSGSVLATYVRDKIRA